LLVILSLGRFPSRRNATIDAGETIGFGGDTKRAENVASKMLKLWSN